MKQQLSAGLKDCPVGGDPAVLHTRTGVRKEQHAMKRIMIVMAVCLLASTGAGAVSVGGYWFVTLDSITQVTLGSDPNWYEWKYTITSGTLNRFSHFYLSGAAAGTFGTGGRNSELCCCGVCYSANPGGSGTVASGVELDCIDRRHVYRLGRLLRRNAWDVPFCSEIRHAASRQRAGLKHV